VQCGFCEADGSTRSYLQPLPTFALQIHESRIPIQSATASMPLRRQELLTGELLQRTGGRADGEDLAVNAVTPLESHLSICCYASMLLLPPADPQQSGIPDNSNRRPGIQARATRGRPTRRRPAAIVVVVVRAVAGQRGARYRLLLAARLDYTLSLCYNKKIFLHQVAL
jgi:hypothetical protein